MSTARALYNEMDQYAAQWLRNLIEAGLIAPGDVAECSIEDLTPNDLRPYNQVHFYAGIGVWSYSLRAAGWPDDRPVWTFSEPCQPFSAAGKRGGTSDERYLRPATHHLVSICRPPVCFGEQVASKDGLGWLDTLQADMEGEGYAVGAFDTCSAGHGVDWEDSQAGEWLRRAIHDCDDPWIKAQLGDFADFARGNFSEGGHHIRQRLRFVAERVDNAAGPRHVGAVERAEGDPRDEARLRLSGAGRSTDGLADAVRDGTEYRSERGLGTQAATDSRDGSVPGQRLRVGLEGTFGGVADTNGRQLEGLAEFRGSERDRADAGWAEGSGCAAARRDDGRLGDDDAGLEGQRRGHQAESGRDGAVRPVAETGQPVGLADANGGEPRKAGSVQPGGQYGQQQEDRRTGHGRSGADARDGDGRFVDWLFCRDAKWRATRPGTLPLASNAAARVGRLRAYGNAVDAEATIQFIEAYLAVESDRFRLTDVSLLSPKEDVFS